MFVTVYYSVFRLLHEGTLSCAPCYISVVFVAGGTMVKAYDFSLFIFSHNVHSQGATSLSIDSQISIYCYVPISRTQTEKY